MAPKRKTDAAQSSPSKSKEAKVSAGDEEAARVAGTCLVVAGAQLCRGDDGAFFDAMCNQTDLVKNTNKYTVFTVLPYPTGGKRGPRVLCLYPLS